MRKIPVSIGIQTHDLSLLILGPIFGTSGLKASSGDPQTVIPTLGDLSRGQHPVRMTPTNPDLVYPAE